MATQVQLRRGTSAQNDAFTGATGELTYDTTNKRVRVHDGGTAGGFEIKTEDGSGNTIFADNEKAIFGAGSDLQIWHNSTGGYSIIRDAGTGDLYIEGSANIRLRDPDGRQSATFTPNGSQTFYHANSLKLTTTSTGIDVTGDITFGDSHFIGDGGGDNLEIISGSGENFLLKSDGGVITFGDNVPNEYARFDSSGNLLVGTTDTLPSNDTSGSGIALRSDGVVAMAGSNTTPLRANRTGNDGDIVELRKNGSTVGSIGNRFGAMYVHSPDGTSGSGLRFADGLIQPCESNGNDSNGDTDLGQTNSKFKDLYLSGSIVNPSGDLTLDISGNINIDADGGNVTLKDGGTTFGQFSIDNNGLTIVVPTIDTDFRVNGNDGGSTITALQLDMSDGGTAIFNNKIRGAAGSDGSPTYSFGTDTHTGMFSPGNDFIGFSSGGTEVLRITNGRRITTYNCTNTNGSLNLVGEGGLSFRAVSFQHVGNGSEVGYIGTTASSTVYNTSSDYRLKENVTADWDATTRLKQLNPVRFNFIADADTTVDGFLAHEVQSVVPEAISGVKDATQPIGNITDANNNILEENVKEPFEILDGQTWTQTGTEPVYQGIDQSKLVPLLVKTIQELEARIVALETA